METAKLMLLLALLPLLVAVVRLSLTLNADAVSEDTLDLMLETVVATKSLVASFAMFCLLARPMSANVLATPVATMAVVSFTMSSSALSYLLIARPEALVPTKLRLLLTVLTDTAELTVLLLRLRLDASEALPVLRTTSPAVLAVATESSAPCEELKPAVMPLMLVMFKLVVLLAVLRLPEDINWLPLTETLEPPLTASRVTVLLP